MAFEISPDDVFVVLLRHHLVSSIDDPQVMQCFEDLDTDDISAQALQGDDLDEQTGIALAAIEASLIEDGLIVGPALLA